uniref:Uncharacterized protein n=1 Tax=Trichogramma kaykai TaxID=54128 RepID=A0ABD2X041_9HYME
MGSKDEQIAELSAKLKQYEVLHADYEKAKSEIKQQSQYVQQEHQKLLEEKAKISKQLLEKSLAINEAAAPKPVVTGTIGNLEEFSLKGDWYSWKESLEQYFIANNVQEAKKVSLFLTLVDSEAYCLLRNLCTPAMPSEKGIKDLFKIMSDHLNLKPSYIMESYLSIASSKKDHLRDQFIWGIKCEKTIKRLLGENDLTFNRAIEIATAIEAANKDAAAINKQSDNNGLHFLQGKNVKGTVNVNVQYDNNCKNLELFVFPGKSAPVVGHDWQRAFGIVKTCDESLLLNAIFSASNVNKKYINEFNAVCTDKLGKYTGGTFKLHLKADAKPIFCKPRPIPYAMKEKIVKELQRLISEGLLEPVENSDWATPIVPVLKSNGQIRLCDDYKVTLNSHLKIDKHPIPRVPDLLATLREQHNINLLIKPQHLSHYKTTIFCQELVNMEKLQFEVIMKGVADGKTIMCVNSIATQHRDRYSLPLELQPATLHKEFVKTTVYARVKNVLKKRHQKRSVWVELTEELKKSYFDECGNIIFEDILLEEFVEALDETKNEESLADVVKQLMQKESATQNLRKVSEKFNIEKYSVCVVACVAIKILMYFFKPITMSDRAVNDGAVGCDFNGVNDAALDHPPADGNAAANNLPAAIDAAENDPLVAHNAAEDRPPAAHNAAMIDPPARNHARAAANNGVRGELAIVFHGEPYMVSNRLALFSTLFYCLI